MTDMVVDYVDERGLPFPGLERVRRPGGITVHQYDPERVTCPTTDGTAVGDLACRIGSSPADGLMVRLEDGWHRMGVVTIERHPEEREDLRTIDGSIVSWRASTPVRATVTLTDVDPEVVALLSGTPGWEDAHPRGRVSTPTGRDPFWECSACGAVTADEQLFREAGCTTR